MVRGLLLSSIAGVLFVSTTRANDQPLEVTLPGRWLAAYNSGDIEGLGAMYAADARLQQGYCPVVEGREAITKFWRGDMGDGTSTTRLEVVDTFMADDVIYLSGNYAVEFGQADAPRKQFGGAYVQIWRREGASDWSIVRETWTNLACAQIHVGPDEDADEAPADAAI